VEHSRILYIYIWVTIFRRIFVGGCFTINLVSIQPETAKIQTFCDYLVDTYIDDDPDFPPEIWAIVVILYVSEYLTTNACQISYHSKFNYHFASKYIYIFGNFKTMPNRC